MKVVHDRVDQIGDDPITAVVHVLKEAAKTRMITASDGVLQWWGKCLQKPIHDQLRRVPYFEHIGKPVEAMDFEAEWDCGPDEFINSVDYKAATDFVNMNYTEFTWACLCRSLGLDTFCFETGRAMLCGQVLSTCDAEGNEQLVGQTNGQLMGCILSFPILCILNHVCLRLAALSVGRPFVGRCNGDDAVCKMTTASYERWLPLIDRVGFRRSPGKNYCSTKFLSLNSTIFIRGLMGWRRLPFLNLGLLLGHSRVLSDDPGPLREKDRDYTLGACCRALVRDLDPVHAKEARGLFIAYNREKLAARPWYVPEHLGGFGLPLLPGEDLWSLECDPRTRAVVGYLASLSPVRRFRWQRRMTMSKPRLAHLERALQTSLLLEGNDSLDDDAIMTAREWLGPNDVVERPRADGFDWLRRIALKYYAGRAIPNSPFVPEPLHLGRVGLDVVLPSFLL
jgi:hypothetical protein